MQTVPKLAACINAARQANEALGGVRGRPSKLSGGCAEAANTGHGLRIALLCIASSCIDMFRKSLLCIALYALRWIALLCMSLVYNALLCIDRLCISLLNIAAVLCLLDLALMLSPRSLSIRSAHGPLQIFNVANDIWTA